jgi:hypothetical protein
LAILAAIRRALDYIIALPTSSVSLAAPPFPFAGLRVVTGNTAPNHFVAPFVARYDERNEIAAAKTKPAKSDHDDELRQLTHGPCPLKSSYTAGRGARASRQFYGVD